MTLKSIAEFMKIEGHKGRKGADFNAMLVKCILDKENYYRGYYNYGGINEESGTNSGTLILDATCAPQNISYGYKK